MSDYEGEFRNDKRHGKGQMTFQNGNRYEVRSHTHIHTHLTPHTLHHTTQ